SATDNALIVAFITSPAGPGAVSENFEPKDVREFETWRQDHYKEHPVNLANGAQIPVLPYGDELTLQTASKDVSSFDSFMRSILRLIAASLDVTYEELSMDYSQTNYSSARAALIHAWSATVALKDVWPVIRPPFRADVSIGFVESFDYL
ncbi:MAG: phage portal protein, partial [Brevundimonas sp.]